MATRPDSSKDRRLFNFCILSIKDDSGRRFEQRSDLLRLGECSLTHAGQDVQRIDRLKNFVLFRDWFVFENLLGALERVNLLLQVHVILHHPLLVLFCKCLATERNHLYLFERRVLLRDVQRSLLGCDVLNSFLETVLKHQEVYFFS